MHKQSHLLSGGGKRHTIIHSNIDHLCINLIVAKSRIWRCFGDATPEVSQ
eukprot:08232.XXX_79727_79876_1 [CDS] Oithona nana genome sequencing.